MFFILTYIPTVFTVVSQHGGVTEHASPYFANLPFLTGSTTDT